MIPASFARKTVAILILVALVCAAGFFASYSYQSRRLQDARSGRINAEVSERVGKTAADEAISSIKREQARDDQTKKNAESIRGASNAADGAGDAGNIGLGVLCERASYRHDPACLQRKNTAASPK